MEDPKHKNARPHFERSAMGLLQGAKTFVDEIIATSAEKEVLEETASKLMKKMELLRRKGRNKARMRAAAELQKAPQKLFEGLKRSQKEIKKRFFLVLSSTFGCFVAEASSRSPRGPSSAARASTCAAVRDKTRLRHAAGQERRCLQSE